MKVLAAAMALAIAIVMALPLAGETAQKKKKKYRAAPAATHQRLDYAVPGSRTRAGTPCVTYTWEGCLGWDPDPFIRSMIDRDRGKDDR
jgi:hypothetical protein